MRKGFKIIFTTELTDEQVEVEIDKLLAEVTKSGTISITSDMNDDEIKTLENEHFN